MSGAECGIVAMISSLTHWEYRYSPLIESPYINDELKSAMTHDPVFSQTVQYIEHDRELNSVIPH